MDLGGTLLFQPFQDRLVGFFRLFLLDPVTAIETDHVHIGYERGKVWGLRNRIPITMDHERGLLDDRVHLRQQVPVAVEVPVPVYAAREP